MIFLRTIFTLAFVLTRVAGWGQSIMVSVSPGVLQGPLNTNYTPGTFFVPKTATGFTDFMNNGTHQAAIRTNVIESALNNAVNLNQCLVLLQSAQADLVNLSQKCDRLIFIFEKMPAWLSSSSDGSPAQTPGWYVLNTKPPASWIAWQAAVDSIASKIVNQMGITNAWFEVWNEPDIGSWTGTMNEYWRLYRTTYDGVKSASLAARVGGPAVNGWANSIGWQPPYGYVSNIMGDSSLIGQLLDSSIVWNRVPDFISWHNFNMNYYESGNAAGYISSKVFSLSIPAIPLIVSEWNAPSAVRESMLGTAYTAKVPLVFETFPAITCNVFAAWQDFSQSTNEFHNDYGLLSYGAIQKPAYYATLLNEKMNGTVCSTSTNSLWAATNMRASVAADTVFLMITNYSPPPLFEALNFTLAYGCTVNDLDAAGYIDLANSDLSHLDSIYRGLIAINVTNTLEQGIYDGISLYQFYDSVAAGPRSFNLALSGYTGNYQAEIFLIDSTHNNMMFRYDSIIAAGYTQNNAIAYVTATQSLQAYVDTLYGGMGSVMLDPNAVCLVRIAVPGVSQIEDQDRNTGILLCPNPVTDFISVNWKDESQKQLTISDLSGRIVKVLNVHNGEKISVDDLAPGIYFINEAGTSNLNLKFVKE